MNLKEAVYINEKKKFELREYFLGNLPSPYHLKIRVNWVGICGSDLHSIETDFLPELFLGHEWVGEVVEVGSSVKKFKIGDSVTSTVLIKCGYCPSCLVEREVCDNQFSLAVSNGMLREMAFLPEGSLVKVPEQANGYSTLYEILAVAENVFMKTTNKIKKEEKILIMGAGLLGISLALVFNREGYQTVMVETIPSRIERARHLGIHCLHLGETLLEKSFNDAFTFILDATGDHLNGKGGWKYIDHFGARNFKAVILAKYLNHFNLKTDRFFSKQACLEWIQGCTEKSLQMAIHNWKDKINFLGENLITHTYDLDEVNEAFDMAKRRESAGRVILKIRPTIP